MLAEEFDRLLVAGARVVESAEVLVVDRNLVQRVGQVARIGIDVAESGDQPLVDRHRLVVAPAQG